MCGECSSPWRHQQCAKGKKGSFLICSLLAVSPRIAGAACDAVPSYRAGTTWVAAGKKQKSGLFIFFVSLLTLLGRHQAAGSGWSGKASCRPKSFFSSSISNKAECVFDFYPQENSFLTAHIYVVSDTCRKLQTERNRKLHKKKVLNHLQISSKLEPVTFQQQMFCITQISAHPDITNAPRYYLGLVTESPSRYASLNCMTY